MKLASHNTMSYLTPMQWYLKPLYWMARCQNKTWQEQLEVCDMIDLRLQYHKGELCFSHNLFLYDGSAFWDIINAVKGTDKFVRIFLEGKPTEEEVYNFKKLCYALERDKVRLCGGYQLHKGKIYHTEEDPEIVHCYSSMTAWVSWFPKLDDLLPWLYAKVHNEQTYEEFGEYDGFVMMDFV